MNCTKSDSSADPGWNAKRATGSVFGTVVGVAVGVFVAVAVTVAVLVGVTTVGVLVVVVVAVGDELQARGHPPDKMHRASETLTGIVLARWFA